VIETVKKVTGRKVAAIGSPRRAGDPARLVASSQKIKKELGWFPRYPDLETIVKTAYHWHREHPKGYDD
jgi:UDP-glucose 4-epimerase